MSNIRIAHITSVATSLRYLLTDQIKRLQAEGYEVTGISSPVPLEDVTYLNQNNIGHIAVPIERQISPLNDLNSLVKLYRVIRRQDFTIVHTHNPKPGLLGQFAARMANVPIIVNTIHGFYFHENMPAAQRQFYISLEKIAARCSTLILSQNQEDIETALREGIASEDKIKYLGNGIDLGVFDPSVVSRSDMDDLWTRLNIKPTDRVVGFVGRLAGVRKGFTDFLDVAASLFARNSDTVFLIIGSSDPGKSDSVDPAILETLPFASSIRYLGSVPNHELPQYYRLMNVVVLPSLFEGVPRVLMEATAMEVPIVATNVRGNREVVENAKNGFLVPLRDTQALFEAISSILDNAGLASNMGDMGRKIALQKFDQDRVFQKVIDNYSRLLHDLC